jgi:hypothetical protein
MKENIKEFQEPPDHGAGRGFVHLKSASKPIKAQNMLIFGVKNCYDSFLAVKSRRNQFKFLFKNAIMI